MTSLTGYELFSAFGGDNFYWRDISKVNKPSAAVVLGGYTGESSLRLALLGYTVTVFEPVAEYASKIRDLMQKHKASCEILEYAASVSSDDIILEVSGDSTSQFLSDQSKTRITCRALDFSKWMLAREGKIDFLEINIEGAEYGVLDAAIRDGSITKVEGLVVQFHNLSIESLSNRNAIRLRLSETHHLEWSFDWVWEKWVAKDSASLSKSQVNVLPIS